ncbi:MAG: phosphatidylglycerophosphatase, partial [Gammaproteobacteria bacterium SG8_31]
MKRVSARTVLTDPVHFLAFGFGAGLAPRAPGTFGTAVG